MMTREEARTRVISLDGFAGIEDSLNEDAIGALADLLMETQRQTLERAIEVLNGHIQTSRDIMMDSGALELARNQLIRELEATR